MQIKWRKNDKLKEKKIRGMNKRSKTEFSTEKEKQTEQTYWESD